MDLIRIGQYIAGKRKALGLTQKQLAEKLGVSDKSVSKWERGVCLPDVSLYTELCAALGIGINEFLSGDDIAENDLPRRAEENILQTAADGKRAPSLRKRGSSASPFFPRKPGTPSAPLNAPPQPKGMTPQRPCGSGLPDNTIPKAILRKRSGLPS